MSKSTDEPGTLRLLFSLPGQVISLMKAELGNAKKEVRSRLIAYGIGIGLIVVALALVCLSLPTLIFSAVAALALVWPTWLAALVVGLGIIVLGLIAIIVAVLLFRKGAPIPREALGRLKKDLAVLQEIKFNASAKEEQSGGEREDD